MKKTLLLFIAMLFSFFVVAQNGETQNSWMEHPDVVIKGEELKNLPSGTLSEMLIGQLPGIDDVNVANQENLVVFIVDGFVWKSIDAININNVEEIAYYRGGLNVKLGVQNETINGVIVITTKTAKFKQPLGVDVNTLVGANFYKENLAHKKQRLMQSYNVVLSQGLDKFAWRASAVYNSATRNLSDYDFTKQFQLNGDLRFSPLKWLDLGLNLNYAPVNGDLQFDNQDINGGIRSDQIKIKHDNWNGAFYLKVKPIKGLINEIRVLKSRIAAEQDLYTATNPSSTIKYYSTVSSGLKYKTLSLQNDLSYRFSVDEDKIKFKMGGIFQYYNFDTRSDNNQRNSMESVDFIGGEVIIVSESFNQSLLKYYTLVGDFSMNLYDILSLQAGLRSDKYKNSSTKAKYAPYFYADLNLKQALLREVNEVNEISLFGSYGEYSSTTVSNVTLNMTNDWNIFEDVLGNPSINNYPGKAKAHSLGLKTMFFDRVRLSADLYKNDNFLLLYLPVYPNQTVINRFPLEYKGWRIWGSADIIRNSAFKWNTGLNVFENKLKLVSSGDGQMGLNNQNSDKPTIQAGMQQRFSYANFSLNLNGSAYFNSPLFEFSNLSSMVGLNNKYATFINLNYLSFGYNFKDQISGKKLKDLKVSFVARNLIQRKIKIEDNVLSKTVGLALNASF